MSTDGTALLERAIQYGARKYIIIARTLLARISMLSADFGRAAEEIKAAVTVLEQYPAPLCAWRTYAMLGRIEMQRGNPDAGVTAYRVAVSFIRYLYDHIDEQRLCGVFLRSDAIGDVFRHAGERMYPE